MRQRIKEEVDAHSQRVQISVALVIGKFHLLPSVGEAERRVKDGPLSVEGEAFQFRRPLLRMIALCEVHITNGFQHVRTLIENVLFRNGQEGVLRKDALQFSSEGDVEGFSFGGRIRDQDTPVLQVGS